MRGAHLGRCWSGPIVGDRNYLLSGKRSARPLGKLSLMETQLPGVLRQGTRGRNPLDPDGATQLVAQSLEERRAARLAELDRLIGRVDLPVPPTPVGPTLGRTARVLPPGPDATGGIYLGSNRVGGQVRP